MKRRLDAAITRLETIGTRLDARITKLEKMGVTLTTSKELLAKARADIATAKTKSAGIIDTLAQIKNTADSPRAAFEQMKRQ